MTDSFNLEQLQQWMHGTLIRPGSTQREDAQSLMKANTRLSAQERLAIYQRSYYQRITACMRDQFPALCHALGEPLFNRFVAEYIAVCPPESYTLYDLGRRFAGFLDDTRPDKDQEEREVWFDFMVDLAHFERMVFTRFDCVAAKPETLATVDTPDENLAAQPSLAIGYFRFDVAGYYHAVRAEGEPQLPDPEQSCMAILRKDNSTYTIPVSEAHARMLEAMCNGANVDEALEAVANWSDRKLENIQEAWKGSVELRTKWIETGVFVDLNKA